MQNQKVAFTQAELSKLAGTEGQRIVVKDPKTVGLRAELREGGGLTFYLFRRLPGGEPIRYRIGPFPEITVDGARKEAAEQLAKIMRGENPVVARKRKRGEPTLQAAFDHWLETHAKQHKRTWQDDERQFKKYLSSLHNRKLSTIIKADVVAIHAKWGKEHGPYTANRVLALLRAIINKADELGYSGVNPAAKVKKFREQSRDRFLQPAELPKFFAAVQAEPNETLRDFFLLALFTGARRGNVQSMKWVDVDLEQGIWRIPEAKAGRVQHVPLASPALAILRRRKETANGDEYVLASHGKRGHLVEVKEAWKRITKAAGLADLRPHDLRRTLGSYMAIQGASLNIIGATLGHSQVQTTQVYARLTNTAVADGVTKAVAFIEATAKPEDEKQAKPKRTRKPKAK